MSTDPARLRTTARNRLTLAGVAFAAGISIAVAAQAGGAAALADGVDLPAIEQARLKALVDADTATAGRLMAADFELVNPGGAALGRDDYLGAVEAGFIDYLVFEPASAIDVRRSGNAAVLRFQVTFDLVVAGTRLSHAGWITELTSSETVAGRSRGSRPPQFRTTSTCSSSR